MVMDIKKRLSPPPGNPSSPFTTTFNDHSSTPPIIIMSTEHDKRVLAGHKAAINSMICLLLSLLRSLTYLLDPNVSEEAKEHSAKIVEEMGGSTENAGNPDPVRVEAGYKAALKSVFIFLSLNRNNN